MIAPGVVSEIRDLLAEGGLSQRTIAQRMGVSRGTVSAIARGKRPNSGPHRGAASEQFVPPGGPPRRCPGCGGMVQMPCLVCHVRAVKQRRRFSGRACR